MTAEKPADAVREALDLFEELANHNTYNGSPDQVAAVRNHIANLEARLAALAGAGPVGKPHDGPCGPDTSCDADCMHAYYASPHAPAKAREVTDADVQRAVRIMEEYDSDALITFAGMRAALATFAEGADDVSISAQNRP